MNNEDSFTQNIAGVQNLIGSSENKTVLRDGDYVAFCLREDEKGHCVGSCVSLMISYVNLGNILDCSRRARKK